MSGPAAVHAYLEEVSKAIFSGQGAAAERCCCCCARRRRPQLQLPVQHPIALTTEQPPPMSTLCAPGMRALNSRRCRPRRVDTRLQHPHQTAAARVKPLFRLDHPLLQPSLAGLQAMPEPQLASLCARRLDQPWAGIVAGHLAAAAKRSAGRRPDQAYALYTAPEGPAKGALNALAEAPADLWVAAVLEQTASNAVLLAREADAALMLEGDSSKVRA